MKTPGPACTEPGVSATGSEAYGAVDGASLGASESAGVDSIGAADPPSGVVELPLGPHAANEAARATMRSRRLNMRGTSWGFSDTPA